jgi:hypothetical protein
MKISFQRHKKCIIGQPKGVFLHKTPIGGPFFAFLAAAKEAGISLSENPLFILRTSLISNLFFRKRRYFL